MSEQKNESDQWLDAMLAQSVDYIDDNGFTDRVMQRLPRERHHQLFGVLRMLLDVLVVAVLLGAAVYLLQPFVAGGVESLHTILDFKSLFQSVRQFFSGGFSVLKTPLLMVLGLGIAAAAGFMVERKG